MLRTSDCRYGRMTYSDDDLYVGRSLDLYGEWSEGEVSLWRQFLAPGMNVVDVGANIGAFTLPLARIVHPGRVYSFEPHPDLYQMLIRNIELNSLKNVDTYSIALGENHGASKMQSIDLSGPSNLGLMSVGEGDCDVIIGTLDDVLGATQIHFMKMDVEGMEREVLLGARRNVELNRPILYVENDRAGKSLDLLELMLSMGYRLFWHLPWMYNPDNWLTREENVFQGGVSINVLGVHRQLRLSIDGFTEITSPDDRPELTPRSYQG